MCEGGCCFDGMFILVCFDILSYQWFGFTVC